MERGFDVIRVRPGSVAAKLIGEGSTPQPELPLGFAVTRFAKQAFKEASP